jgi:predicted DNA-binding transcriptional regulator AlpA
VAEREKLMSVEDLAAYLGRSPRTVLDWNSRGLGPKYIRLGRRIAYRPADVEKWLRTREVARGA